MAKGLHIRGQSTELLQDVLVEQHTVHENPEDFQSCEHNVHMILCAFSLHSAMAIWTNAATSLFASCKHNTSTVSDNATPPTLVLSTG